MDIGKAAERAQLLVSEGAEIIDVGGESTRPNSTPVSIDEELSRVLPILKRLEKSIQVPISIDTTKGEVARRAIDLGVQIVNDISGLTFDPGMIDICAQARVGVVCMHIQGRPQTMQERPQYDDVVTEVRDFLAKRAEAMLDAGIQKEAIVLDPGIGFGKTAENNISILGSIRAFRELGYPILIGHSRKRFLGQVLIPARDQFQRNQIQRGVEREIGTVGVSVALAEQGVEILRLHEVAPTRDCLVAIEAIRSAMKRENA